MKPILSALAMLAFCFAAMADDPKPQDAKAKAIEQSLETFSPKTKSKPCNPLPSHRKNLHNKACRNFLREAA